MREYFELGMDVVLLPLLEEVVVEEVSEEESSGTSSSEGGIWRGMRWIVEEKMFVGRREVRGGDQQNREQWSCRHSAARLKPERTAMD